MRLLEPAGTAEPDLDALYAHPPGVVRANMVTTLDGSATDAEGLSGGLSGPADKEVFAHLRAQADVVLVGAGTVRAEGYGPVRLRSDRVADRRTRGVPDLPALAVVSARLDLDPGLELFDGSGGPVVVLTTTGAPERRRADLARAAEVVEVGDGRLDPLALLQALRDRGFDRVLCEGGPGLLASLVASGALDELCLTVRLSLLGGDGPRPLSGAWLPGWDGELRHALLADDHLLLRLARRPAPTR